MDNDLLVLFDNKDFVNAFLNDLINALESIDVSYFIELFKGVIANYD